MLNSYILSLLEPPHNSELFPVQAILQPTAPSGAGPPVEAIELSQSEAGISLAK